MKNIADHILDIVENSIRAKAAKVEIALFVDAGNFLMTLRFVDDGVGMDAEMVEALQNPFFTTRTTRRIGMGIPLLMQNSEAAGGQVTIRSEQGVGTTVEATYEYKHIDCPPLGDVADAVLFLSTSHPLVRLVFRYAFGEKSYVWDTEEVKEALGDVPINQPELRPALLELLRENMGEVEGKG